jgi:hypothetical protein
MDVLPSRVKTGSREYQENARLHRDLAAQLRQRLVAVRKGGDDKAVATQTTTRCLLPGW